MPAPYYISSENPKCSGWAVVNAAGKVEGCHPTKEKAIAHMVAISIATDNQPGGLYPPEKKKK